MDRRFLPALSALPALAALALAACATGPGIARVEPVDGVVSGQCHLDRVRGAVGLAAAAPTLERARIDSDSLRVRVVRSVAERPASATRPEIPATASGGEELIVETGANHAITGMRCG